MRSFNRTVVQFVRSEDGPTAVEYGVMLALIIVVCIVAVSVLGSSSNGTFKRVGSAANVSS
jgi:pilus assembly protein Flp/PilA